MNPTDVQAGNKFKILEMLNKNKRESLRMMIDLEKKISQLEKYNESDQESFQNNCSYRKYPFQKRRFCNICKRTNHNTNFCWYSNRNKNRAQPRFIQPIHRYPSRNTVNKYWNKNSSPQRKFPRQKRPYFNRRHINLQINTSTIDTRTKLPIIKMKVSNFSAKFLIDTGASCSLLQNSVFKKINDDRRIKNIPNRVSIKSISGENISFLGCKEIPVIFGEKKSFQNFFITREDIAPQYQGIIGYDFLSKHKLIVNLENNTVSSKDTTLTILGGHKQHIGNTINDKENQEDIRTCNLDRAAEKQEAYRDRTAKTKDIRVGDEVYLFTPKIDPKLGKAFTRKYKGPFKVLKKNSPVNYTLVGINEPDNKAIVVHVDRIFPFTQRKTELQISPEVEQQVTPYNELTPLPQYESESEDDMPQDIYIKQRTLRHRIDSQDTEIYDLGDVESSSSDKLTTAHNKDGEKEKGTHSIQDEQGERTNKDSSPEPVVKPYNLRPRKQIVSTIQEEETNNDTNSERQQQLGGALMNWAINASSTGDEKGFLDSIGDYLANTVKQHLMNDKEITEHINSLRISKATSRVYQETWV